MRPEGITPVAIGLGFAALALAVKVQSRVVHRIRTDGGQVRTDEWRMPDALVALVLAVAFVALGVGVVLRRGGASEEVKIEHVLSGSLFFPVLVVGVAAFLRYRGLRIVPALGLSRLGPGKVIGWSLGLVVLAFIFVGVANLVTVAALQGQAQHQPLVNLFRDVARRNDMVAMAKIFFAGVILAPVAEEFIFRGFFYAVGKRYLGPLASGFATALLFAAFHLSLTALGGLFVLAVCLTLAYERTGSLLVPIGMHALFNFTSLGVVWLSAKGVVPPL